MTIMKRPKVIKIIGAEMNFIIGFKVKFKTAKKSPAVR